MDSSRLERVYTISEWYDGARAGIADYQGQPHYYECLQWTDSPHTAVTYALTPLDERTFQLALEDWAIWQRWDAAFKAGMTTMATHPALPEEQERHRELNEMLQGYLRTNPHQHHKAHGSFFYEGNTSVEWQVL